MEHAQYAALVDEVKAATDEALRLRREEVKEALISKNHTGFAIRNSTTINEREMYAAYYDGTYIVRLSIPYNGITIFLPLLIPSLALSFVIAFSLCSPFNV